MKSERQCLGSPMECVLSLSAPKSRSSSRVGMCTCLSAMSSSLSSGLIAGYDSGHILLHDIRSRAHASTQLAHHEDEHEEIEAVLAISDDLGMYATSSHVVLHDLRRPGRPLTQLDLTRQTGGGIHGLALKPQQQTADADGTRGSGTRYQVAVASDYGGVVLVGVDAAKGKLDAGRGSRMKGGHANVCEPTTTTTTYSSIHVRETNACIHSWLYPLASIHHH